VYNPSNFLNSIRNSGYEANKIKYYDLYNLSRFFEIKDGDEPYYYFKLESFKYQREYIIVKINEKNITENEENVTVDRISKDATIISENKINSIEIMINVNN